MKTIWKYPLGLISTFALPQGTKVIHVGFKDNRPTIWIECDPALPVEPRTFVVLATGGDPEPTDVHVGSCIDDVGGLVWHVYEKRV